MYTCAVTTSFLGCLATLFLYFRYILFASIGLPYKIICLVLFLLIGCIPLFVEYSFEDILGKFYPFYRYTLYFIYIGAVILLTLTVIRDALWFICSKFDLCPAISWHMPLKANLYTVMIALLFTVWALYEGTKTPKINTVTLSSPKISQDMTVAVLSDLHIHRVICPQKIKNIIAKTNAQNPDIILLDGDIIDDNPQKVAAITALLKDLKAKYGIYFVTGNHEFYAGYQATVNALQNLGFTLLENNSAVINNIYLAGIPDTFTGEAYGKNADIKQAFNKAQNHQYKILMSHTPTDFKDSNVFDLEISSHTHGGQIFPFHIFTKLHNKYLSGLYKMDNNAYIYVTNGAGQWGPQMRFLAPSEITIIKLTSNK